MSQDRPGFGAPASNFKISVTSHDKIVLGPWKVLLRLDRLTHADRSFILTCASMITTAMEGSQVLVVFYLEKAQFKLTHISLAKLNHSAHMEEDIEVHGAP